MRKREKLLSSSFRVAFSPKVYISSKTCTGRALFVTGPCLRSVRLKSCGWGAETLEKRAVEKAPEGGGSRSPNPLQREPPLAGAFWRVSAWAGAFGWAPTLAGAFLAGVGLGRSFWASVGSNKGFSHGCRPRRANESQGRRVRRGRPSRRGGIRVRGEGGAAVSPLRSGLR